MLDYLMLVNNSPTTKISLKNNSLLKFYSKVSLSTGEIKLSYSGELIEEANNYGLKFTIYSSGRIEVRGSLHKFFKSVTNGICHNYDQFTYSDSVKAVNLLSTMFNLHPNETTVHNIEIGVNFNLDNISASQIIGYVRAFNTKSFDKLSIKPPNKGYGKEVYFTQYGIKVYDKGLQYGLKNEVLRFEIKYIKMEAFESGLKLLDLISIDKWMEFAKRLEEALKQVIFSDNFSNSNLTKKELRLFEFCDNPIRWENIQSRKIRYNKKKSLERLISEKGEFKFRDILTARFKDIVCQLLDKSVINLQNLKRQQLGHSDHLSIRLLCPFYNYEYYIKRYPLFFKNYKDRFCSVTGLPLVYYNENTNHLNPKTLKYLHENCEEVFDLLKLEYMHNFINYTSREKNIYEYIAKQIRNRISNSKQYRVGARRISINNQMFLF